MFASPPFTFYIQIKGGKGQGVLKFFYRYLFFNEYKIKNRQAGERGG
jgi:hypothetical protein